MPTCIPQFSLLLEPFTVRVYRGTVIRGRPVGHVHRSAALLNKDPTSPYQQAHSELPEAITQLELQSSSFALTRLFRH